MKAFCGLTTNHPVVASSLSLHIVPHALACHVIISVKTWAHIHTHTQGNPAITEMFVMNISEPHSQWTSLTSPCLTCQLHVTLLTALLLSLTHSLPSAFLPLPSLGFPHLSRCTFLLGVCWWLFLRCSLLPVGLPWASRLVPFLTYMLCHSHLIFSQDLDHHPHPDDT